MEPSLAAVAPVPWLLVVAAAHLGFQLTVQLVVYPALREVAAASWADAHAQHSRRIAPLVGVLYVPLLVVLAWTAVTVPDEEGTWLALVGGLLAVLTTAAVAAPLHGRLGRVDEDGRGDLLATLLLADRIRTTGAAVCLLGAVLLV